MRKAALLYNPDSGGRNLKRQVELESVLVLLRESGVKAHLVLTDSRAHAEEMTRRAVLEGCDTVFAGGGDGTIHNIIQVLANTGVALAILPMGTANALAHDLGLPMNIVAAARTVLQAVPRRVALGRIEYVDFAGQPGTRFFLVVAGAGVDAHLFYELHTETKRRMGITAYYAKAWHLWFSYPMTRFRIEFNEVDSGERREAEVTELLAVRIRNFGGVLQQLAPGASLERNDLRIIFCSTASRLMYLLYVTRGLLRSSWKVRGIDLAHVSRVSCHPAVTPAAGNSRPSGDKIYVEADGELVGTLPAEISVVPGALTLLAPPVRSQ